MGFVLYTIRFSVFHIALQYLISTGYFINLTRDLFHSHNSISIPTGQWSEPCISLRIKLSRTLSIMRCDTTK